MWNPQKAGYLLRNILGSKVVKTNLKGLPYQLFCYQSKKAPRAYLWGFFDLLRDLKCAYVQCRIVAVTVNENKATEKDERNAVDTA
ncbi:hypothetical protein TNCV_1221311 [Trichonephila clavipes]|nr:hypothetical protein TNCV_1221311 [Trichonephila clavipes]